MILRRALALAVTTSALACDRAPDDLREWRATDHHHQEESTDMGGAEAPRVTGSAEAPLPGLEEVTIASWRRACTSCHGELGRGDGPQGMTVRARDLSDPAWQSTTTDAQIEATIRSGKGLMPAFPLPPDTVSGLVKLVRLLNRAPRGPVPSRDAPAAPNSAPSSQ